MVAHVWLGAAVMKPNIPTTPSLRQFPPSDSAGTDSGPRVLLAYEDFEIGLRAMDLFVSVSRQAGADAEAQVSLWRFDFFERSEWRDAAAVQAERADVIILSLRRYDDLPDRVRSWLEKGIKRRTLGHGALVAAFDSINSEKASESEVATYLQTLAKTSGMDFFCGGLGSVNGYASGIAVPLAAAHSMFDGLPEYEPLATGWGRQWGTNE
jgi:hypothetical protein